MTLDDARQAFYEASDTLSENIRKLLFAGIAIVWMFKAGDKAAAGVAFTKALLVPLAAFVIGLVLDILHYLYKGTAWWLFFRLQHRRGVADDAKVVAPRFINVPTFLFFYGKVVACGFGYFMVLKHIWDALH